MPGNEDPRDPHWYRDPMMIEDHERLNELWDWRSEVRGMVGLLKFAVGASLLSAGVSILALMQLLNGQR